MVANPQEYSIDIKHGGGNSVTAGPVTINLSSVGWMMPAPFDVTWKYSESNVPEGDGVQSLSDNNMTGSNGILTTSLYDDDPEDLQAAISLLISKLDAAKGERPYLLLQLWNGAALVAFRRYLDILSASFPMARGTRFQATGICNIGLRFTDPGLYGNTVILETQTVVGGTDVAVLVPGGNMPTKRVTYKIIKDTADNPTGITIDTLGGQLAIGGSLVNANDYWLVDTYEGTVVKSVSSVVSDDIANVSGVFPDITNAADVILINESTTADFTVETRYLEREQ